MSANLFIDGDASFSDDRKYRWMLSRCWNMSVQRDWLGFVMLNPSTADAQENDPTITRCIGFARDLGFNGLVVTNLFGLRATSPEELLAAEHPICRPGPVHRTHYDRLLLSINDTCPMIIAAWGVQGTHRGRDREVFDLFSKFGIELHCLGVTKDGHPRHPLYLPADTKPLLFAMPEMAGGAA